MKRARVKPAHPLKGSQVEPAAGMARRQAIKWMLAATATISVLDARSLAAGAPAVKGYGTDPDLIQVYKPGTLWPLTFTPDQRRTVAALCDLILPADEKSPSASQLNVPDFIDEWISAPYPHQQADRKEILKGLAWLNAESRKRFRQGFFGLSEEQKDELCRPICSVGKCRPALKPQALFFSTFRNLTMGGFYTTPQGMKDIQYLGNVPLTQFDGPPTEVLQFLKLL